MNIQDIINSAPVEEVTETLRDGSEFTFTTFNADQRQALVDAGNKYSGFAFHALVIAIAANTPAEELDDAITSIRKGMQNDAVVELGQNILDASGMGAGSEEDEKND